MKIINITPENVKKESFYCIKNSKDKGFKAKHEWFLKRFKEGLRIKMIKDDNKHHSFIEYIPGKYAWRPVHADEYIFIHCVFTHLKTMKSKGYASLLIKECENDAKARGMKGIAVMTSNGTWITDKRLFLKNGFEEVDMRDRFELLAKKFGKAENPKLIDWNANLKKYLGWHLLYSDQCPYNCKAAEIIHKAAETRGIDINIKKITSADEVRQMPSGFGVFNLVYNGKLIEDHYISERRFLNILDKEITKF